MAHSTKAKPAPKRRKRLSAAERKRTILEAAREQFAKTGDIGGTTTKMIAQRAGVSEAIIYRYFDSKEDLYLEAVVEPLRDVVEKTVAAVEQYPRSVSEDERTARAGSFFAETTEQLTESLPLLGLVLFGEPATAKRFYERCWRPSLDKLSKAWRTYYEETGVKEYPDTDVAARITLGACLMYALDARYGKPFDRKDAAHLLAEASFDGMWLRGT
jgi:AcrR family transcriptional regulator